MAAVPFLQSASSGLFLMFFIPVAIFSCVECEKFPGRIFSETLTFLRGIMKRSGTSFVCVSGLSAFFKTYLGELLKPPVRTMLTGFTYKNRGDIQVKDGKK